jgi:hypothetical protein
MTARTATAATQPGVAAAAAAMLPRGNAIDAACAAVLMAAALEPGVLLGPIHFLVSGPGFGLRCVDGRQRQPGRGAPRPRGWLPSEEIPAAARVAVPALPAAVATALSMFGTITPKRACEPALDVLTRDHPRRAVLASFAREGASALARDPFAEVLTTIAGRFAAGLITRDDLRAVRAPAVACHVHDRLAMAPFEQEGAAPAACHAVCVVDSKGGVAAVCYETVEDGLAIEALGLLAPLRAEPVMRGRRRKDPGATIACATTIALADLDDEDRFHAAIGFAGGARFQHVLDELSLDTALRDRAPAVGVVRGPKSARAYSFTP